MVQPPPPAVSNNTGPGAMTPFDNIIQKLHKVIFKITLPKTRVAKTATIAIEDLHSARDLVASACTSLVDWCEGLYLPCTFVSLVLHRPLLTRLSRRWRGTGQGHPTLPTCSMSPGYGGTAESREMRELTTRPRRWPKDAPARRGIC